MPSHSLRFWLDEAGSLGFHGIIHYILSIYSHTCWTGVFESVPLCFYSYSARFVLLHTRKTADLVIQNRWQQIPVLEQVWVVCAKGTMRVTENQPVTSSHRCLSVRNLRDFDHPHLRIYLPYTQMTTIFRTEWRSSFWVGSTKNSLSSHPVKLDLPRCWKIHDHLHWYR